MTNEINNSITELKKGNLILYPADTGWSIGCDATNEEAVEKVQQLKYEGIRRPLTCLVAHQAMLERHVQEVPDVAYDIMDLATKPTTIIFDQPKNLAKNLIGEDNTIAIRVASNKFCQYMIQKFGKPLIASPASISGQHPPQNFKTIGNEILSGVDYVVNLQRQSNLSIPSSIIKLGNDGIVKVIRE